LGEHCTEEKDIKTCDRQDNIVRFRPTKPENIGLTNSRVGIRTAAPSSRKIAMVQVDGTRRRTLIKCFDYKRMQEVIRTTHGQLEFYQENAEFSLVQVDIVSLGQGRVRIANLPSDLPDRTLRETMSIYGTVNGISEESWSKLYRNTASNRIRVVELSLKLHIQSHMVVAGIRVLTSYEGLPLTCHGCNGAGHQ